MKTEVLLYSSCSYGYYGSVLNTDDSTQLGVGCISCDCNNHGDMTADDLCDIDSGICTRCVDHTEGNHCEHCIKSFYMNRQGMCVGK